MRTLVLYGTEKNLPARLCPNTSSRDHDARLVATTPGQFTQFDCTLLDLQGRGRRYVRDRWLLGQNRRTANSHGRGAACHAGRPGVPGARQRGHRPDRPCARSRARGSWTVRITPAEPSALARLETIGELVPDTREALAESAANTLRFRSGPPPESLRPTWNEHSAPAAGAWKSSAWDTGSTSSSRSGRPLISKRPTASRNGEARWPSATPGCRPRAGSIFPTRSHSGLTECPTSQPFTTAT